MDDSFWAFLFAANTVLLVVLLGTIPFLTPGTGSYVIAVVSLIVVLSSMLGLCVVIVVGWRPFDLSSE